MNILMIGCSGHIGFYTLVELLRKGHRVVVVDHYSRPQNPAFRFAEKLTRKEVVSYNIDVFNTQALSKVFEAHRFDAVIHCFWANAITGTTPENITSDYENNPKDTDNLCQTMQEYNVKNLIFISPVSTARKSSTISTHSPSASRYSGNSELNISNALSDLALSDSNWNIVLLKYPKPNRTIHTNKSERMNPFLTPRNLLPYISLVVEGASDFINAIDTRFNRNANSKYCERVHVVNFAHAQCR